MNSHSHSIHRRDLMDSEMHWFHSNQSIHCKLHLRLYAASSTCSVQVYFRLSSHLTHRHTWLGLFRGKVLQTTERCEWLQWKLFCPGRERERETGKGRRIRASANPRGEMRSLSLSLSLSLPWLCVSLVALNLPVSRTAIHPSAKANLQVSMYTSEVTGVTAGDRSYRLNCDTCFTPSARPTHVLQQEWVTTTATRHYN